MFSRVVVVGANGAGKTWVAKRLAACTGATLIHKDALALITGWVQRPHDQVHAQVLDQSRELGVGRWTFDIIIGGAKSGDTDRLVGYPASFACVADIAP